MPDGMSALSMQVGMAIEHIRAQDRELEHLRMRMRRTDQRLDALELSSKRRSLGNRMRDIASPREWAIALLVVTGAIWGIITPEEVRDEIRSLIGLPPPNQQGPG